MLYTNFALSLYATRHAFAVSEHLANKLFDNMNFSLQSCYLPYESRIFLRMICECYYWTYLITLSITLFYCNFSLDIKSDLCVLLTCTLCAYVTCKIFRYFTNELFIRWIHNVKLNIHYTYVAVITKVT